MLRILIIILLITLLAQKQNKETIENNTFEKISSISIKDCTKFMIKFFAIIGIGMLLAIILYLIFALLILGPILYFH